LQAPQGGPPDVWQQLQQRADQEDEAHRERVKQLKQDAARSETVIRHLKVIILQQQARLAQQDATIKGLEAKQPRAC